MYVPWKRGDTEPFRWRLTRNGRGQSLEGVLSVVMNVVPVIPTVGITINRGAVEVVEVARGDIEYDWAVPPDTAGMHRLEFEVEWADGTVKTFPDGGHIDFEIIEDLG